MPIVSFANQQITRLRAVDGTDEYGNDVLDWSAPDELPISGVSVQPEAAPEATDPARDAVGARWLVIADPGTDVTAVDRVSWNGQLYSVDGQPLEFSTGILDHVEFRIAAVRG